MYFGVWHRVTGHDFTYTISTMELSLFTSFGGQVADECILFFGPVAEFSWWLHEKLALHYKYQARKKVDSAHSRRDLLVEWTLPTSSHLYTICSLDAETKD